MDKKISESILLQELAAGSKKVVVGAEYRHYKNNLYKVITLGLLEENNKVCVIYQAQYGEHLTFIRPLANWLETVNYNGKKVSRFALVK